MQVLLFHQLYCTICTDIHDLLSLPLPIVHWFRQVFRATSRIGTELLYVGSSWLSCLCSFMWRGPQEYITNKLVLTSPVVSRMSGSFNFDIFVMGGRSPYSCCFVGCYLQFSITRSILLWLPSSFFLSIRLVCVHVVHPYRSINTTAAWKELRFIQSVRSDFHMTNSQSMAVHAFASRVLMSVSVDETLLPR